MESGLDEGCDIYQEQGKGSADGRKCTDLESGVLKRKDHLQLLLIGSMGKGGGVE